MPKLTKLIIQIFNLQNQIINAHLQRRHTTEFHKKWTLAISLVYYFTQVWMIVNRYFKNDFKIRRAFTFSLKIKTNLQKPHLNQEFG